MEDRINPYLFYYIGTLQRSFPTISVVYPIKIVSTIFKQFL